MFCIPVVSRNNAEALRKIALSEPLADMVEIRLDVMETFNVNEIIKAASVPVLVTYRSRREGGKGSADVETHAKYVLTAIQSGADLVDVELSLPRKWRKKIFDARGRSEIIISTHINDGTPSRVDLEKIFRDCADTGADIVKIVTRAETWADNLRVLELIPKAHGLGIGIIAFCMGPIGKISRIASYLMGGYLTFASLEDGEESAEGQIPIRQMKEIVDILRR
jgi:3-dehydroquinate dehydratase type I